MGYQTLISAEQLFPNLGKSDWVVIDTRFDLMQPEAGRQAYLQGHIDTAFYAHLNDDLSSQVTQKSGRHPLPSVDQFLQLCQSWGIHSDSQVVVYDDVNGAVAARLWWMLRWIGHPLVAVLEGGISAWGAHGFGLSASIPSVKRGSLTARPDHSMWLSAADVASKISTPGFVLIDVRDSERFEGIAEPIDVKKGHVPGAINLPFKANLGSAGCFLSPDHLTTYYQQKIPHLSSSELVCMCGSGVTACHSLLAMEVAGISGAKLYPGSWSEWIQDPSRPLVNSDSQ